MGFLIVIDGLDGSGKNTQSTLLYERLVESGRKVRMISFPVYESDSSALVRMYLNGEFGSDPDSVNSYAASAFFAVDRYASFKKDWKKDYDAGSIIIANRYTTANAIHQLTKLPEEEHDAFLSWLEEFEFSLLGLPKPDLTFMLEVPVEKSLELIDTRGEKKDIHENREHLSRAYKAAMEVSEKWGWIKFSCIGTNGKMMSKKEISDILWKKVTEHI